MRKQKIYNSKKRFNNRKNNVYNYLNCYPTYVLTEGMKNKTLTFQRTTYLVIKSLKGENVENCIFKNVKMMILVKDCSDFEILNCQFQSPDFKKKYENELDDFEGSGDYQIHLKEKGNYNK